MEKIVEEGYGKALEVLRENQTSMGYSASPEKVVNYYSVWARDHSITSLAALLTNETNLVETAKTGLLLLLKTQGDHGQIPSYIEIENRKKVYGGLGLITSIDSNMWTIIATAQAYRKTKDKRFMSSANRKRYKKLYHLLRSFDSNDCGLIEVHLAGDWADVFNRSYHVLYDECLYYEALKSLLYLFQKAYPRYEKDGEGKKIRRMMRHVIRRKAKAKKRVNSLFWITKENWPRIKEEYMIAHDISEKEINSFEYYQSHLTPFKLYWSKRFDSFGNLIAIATGICNNSKGKKIVSYALKNEINKPFPIKALSPPVYKNEKDWEPIYRAKEKPHYYHNGGIWPVIAGFWIYTLVKTKNRKKAEKEIEVFANALKKRSWGFQEYMHGKTGKRLGRSKQAWSAAGYIIAYHALKHNSNIFDYR